MATKEQERKALEQIRKIVDGLGKDSYIGIAFEGCFDDAEQNIENDWGCSQHDELENAKKMLAAWSDKCKGMADLIEAQKTEIGKWKNEAEENRQDCQHWLDRAVERDKKVTELKSAVADKDNEIVHLKAKLYDLITK